MGSLGNCNTTNPAEGPLLFSCGALVLKPSLSQNHSLSLRGVGVVEESAVAIQPEPGEDTG